MTSPGQPYAEAVVEARLDWGNLDAEFEARVKAATEKAAEVARRNLERIKLAAKVELKTSTAEFRRTTQEKLDARRLHANVNLRVDFKNLRERLAALKLSHTVELRADTARFNTDVRESLSRLQQSRAAQMNVGLNVTAAEFRRFVTELNGRLTAANIHADVRLDTANAMSQIMALQAAARNIRIGGTGSGSGGGGGGNGGGASSRDSLAAATERLARAQAAQEDSAGRLRVEEARLAELRNQANVPASRLAAAEEALGHARRTHERSLRDVVRAQHDLRVVRDGGIEDMAANVVGAAARAGLSLTKMIRPATLAKVALIGLGVVTFIPLIASASEALGVIALLPAAAMTAAAGLAAVVVGLNGVFAAFGAISAETESADADAKARARAIESAAKQMESAEKNVVKANKNSLDAQKDLNRARKDATQSIEDVNFALKGTAIDEKDAALALARAREAYDQTFSDPTSTGLDRAEAALGIDKALRRQDEVARRNQDLIEQAAEANAKGVEGSDEVVAAKERIVEADEQVAEANEAVVEANEAMQEALDETSSSADKAADAMAKLSPNAQAFVIAMQNLGPRWTELRQAVQDKLFANLGDDVTTLANAQLPTLQTGLSGIADVINKNLRGALDGLSSESAVSDFALIFENSRIAIDNVLGGLRNLGGAFLDISAVGSEFLPGLTGEDGFLGWTERFANKISEMRKSGELKDFIQGAIDKFGQLWHIGSQIIALIRNIFSGSKETGDDMLDGISETLDRWVEFTGTPEGQQRIKDFFEEVRQSINEISDALSKVGSVIDTLGGLGNIIGLGKDLLDFSGFGFDTDNRPKASGDAGLALLQRMGLDLEGAKQSINDFWSDFGSNVENGARIVGGKVGELKDSFIEFHQSAIDNLTNGAGVSWEGLRNTITNVADTLTGGAFSKLKDGVGGIGGVFESLGDKVASVWGGIVSVIKNAVGQIGKFLVSLPQINVPAIPGITDGYKIGFKSIGQSMVDWASASSGTGSRPGTGANGKQAIPRGFATGGLFRGVGGPTDDANLIRISNREHLAFVTKAVAANSDTIPWLDAINNGWVPPAGLLHAMVPGYKDGGVVGGLTDYVQQNFPALQMTSGYRSGNTGSYHESGRAVDFSNGSGNTDEQLALANHMADNYKSQIRELIYDDPRFNRQIKDGEFVGREFYANAGDHTNHVHIAMDAPPVAQLVQGKGKTNTEEYVDAIVAEGRRRGISDKGIRIAVATMLAESGGQMYANNSVPESLKFPHDAVGSDHDSIGLFQQRDNGAWGTVADRMDPARSAGMFYEQLEKQDYNNMEPAAAAQAVQRSAFADGSNYRAQLGQADRLLAGAGKGGGGGVGSKGAGFSKQAITRGGGSDFGGDMDYADSGFASGGGITDVFVTNWPGSYDALGDTADAAVTAATVDPVTGQSIDPTTGQPYVGAGIPGATPRMGQYDPSYYGDTAPYGGIEGANAWAARQDFQSQFNAWGIGALKEILGQFAAPLGLEGRVSDGIDNAAAALARSRSADYQSSYVQDNKLADTMIFQNVDERKQVDEMERMLNARTTAVAVTNRNGG